MATKEVTGNRKPGRRPAKASAAYLALVKAYPLREIHSDKELDQAIAVLDSLLEREASLTRQEQDYLDILSNEIERYESVAQPMPNVAGADMLRYLMRNRELNQSQLARATGIAVSTISAILSHDRDMNVSHVRILSRYFGVEPGVFVV